MGQGKRIKTVTAGIAIIAIMTISTLNPNNFDTELGVSFSLDCDQYKIYTNQEVMCELTDISNLELSIWNFHDGSPLVVQELNNPLVSHTFNTTGTYLITVVGYNSLNLSKIETFEVTVLAAFPSISVSSNISMAYEDEPIQFSVYDENYADNNDLTDITSIWQFGDGVTTEGASVTHSYKQAGEYVVKYIATDNQGLTQTEFLNVTIQNLDPITKATSSVIDGNSKVGSTFALEDQIIEFDGSQTMDSQSDISNLRFLWSFDDGSFSNEIKTNHTFTQSGIYTVQLEVSDDNGAVTSDAIEITIGNVNPHINSVMPQSLVFDEGQTVSLEVSASDTKTDQSSLQYDWSTGQKGWLTTVSAYDEFQETFDLSVTDDNGSQDQSSISLQTNNVAPIPSLQQIYAYYNISFAIMGTKWEEVNITLSNEVLPILHAPLIREPGDPWAQNVTFAFLNQDLQEKWKVEVLYKPNGENGGNPVTASMYFHNANDNYTLDHTFNEQQPQTYNWTFYIDPIQWGFPLDVKYHIFDPGNDDVTVYSNIDGQTYNSTFVNAGSRSTNGILWQQVRVANMSSFQYYAVDEDGGTSDMYSLQILETDTKQIEYYSPVFKIDVPDTAYEDEVVLFKSEYLTPQFSNDSSQLTYTWRFGDLTSSTNEKENHFYEHAGFYLIWLEVSNSRFTYATGKWIEIKNRIPEAQITSLPTEIYEDQNLYFEVSNIKDSLSDKFDLTYTWTFSNGYASSNQSFSYAFPTSGTHYVSVAITDDQGSTYEIIKTVEVKNKAPKIIDNLDSLISKEGDTLVISPGVRDSLTDDFQLSYEWEINDIVQTSRFSYWFMENGVYNASLRVTDQDGLSTYQKFVVQVDDILKSITTVDYEIYGDSNQTVLLASSVSGSYFDIHEIEEYGLESCIQGFIVRTSNGECIWSVNYGQHFYSNVTLTEPQSGNYILTTYLKNINNNVDNIVDGSIDAISTSEIRVLGDNDGDELSNELEALGGTDPFDTDTDNDALADPFETAIYYDSPVAQYAEYTRLFFGTDPSNFDTDNDGLPDGYMDGYGELISGTDPLDDDSDDDDLKDGIEVMGWEITIYIDGSKINRPNTNSDPLVGDTDGDGLSDGIEYGLKSDPRNPDSDSDGLDDEYERRLGTSLTDDDTDNDGLSDYDEVNGYTIIWYDRNNQEVNTTVYSDPWRNDTDEDGLLDGYEFTSNTNAASKDTDQDGLVDGIELEIGTYAYKAHTDDDELYDGLEVNGWNITTYKLQGARYNEFGNVTVIQPTYVNSTELVTSDPFLVDTDGDGISDSDELMPDGIDIPSNKASNPRKIDSDGDGIADVNDIVPLMSEYQPPEITSDILVDYDIPLLSFVENIIQTFTAALSDIAEIINGSVDHLERLWNLIKDDPLGDIRSKINNMIKELTVVYAENTNSSRSYLTDTISFDDFSPSITPFNSVIHESKNFLFSIIEDLIDVGDIARIFLAGGDWKKEARRLAREYATDFANDWLAKTENSEKRKDDDWITFEWPDVHVDWDYCGYGKYKYKCWINDIDIDGGFKVNFNFDKITDVISITLGGFFNLDYTDSLNSVFGVLPPKIYINFDVYDESGIDRVDLWVNTDDLSLDNRIYSQPFDGETSGHFEWEGTLDLTEGCLPPEVSGENGDDNNNDDDNDDNGDDDPYEPPSIPGTKPRVIIRDTDGPIFNMDAVSKDYQLQSMMTAAEADQCQKDLVNGATFIMIMTDMNGNQRMFERSVDSIWVEISDKLSEWRDYVFQWFEDAVSWAVGGVQNLFEQGAEVFNDFVEGVENVIEAGIELLNDAFRWVWENIVQEFLVSKLGNYKDESLDLIEEVNIYGFDHSEEFSTGFTSQLFTNTFNETLDTFDNVFQNLEQTLQPVTNLLDSVSSTIGDVVNALGLSPAFVEAILKLGQTAIDIIGEVVNRIINGIVLQMVNKILNFDLVEGIIEFLSNIEQISEDSGLSIFFDEDNQQDPLSSSLFNPLELIAPILNLGDTFHNIQSNLDNFSNILGVQAMFEAIFQSIFSINSNNIFYVIQTALFVPITSIILALKDLLTVPQLEFSNLLMNFNVELNTSDIDKSKRWLIVNSVLENAIDSVQPTFEDINLLGEFLFELAKLFFSIMGKKNQEDLDIQILGSSNSQYYFREFVEEIAFSAIGLLQSMFEIIDKISWSTLKYSDFRSFTKKGLVFTVVTRVIELLYEIYKFFSDIFLLNDDVSWVIKIGYGIGILDDIYNLVDVSLNLQQDYKLLQANSNYNDRDAIRKNKESVLSKFDEKIQNKYIIISRIVLEFLENLFLLYG